MALGPPPSQPLNTSRVPALRNLALPAPPPHQFSQHSHSCLGQNARLFVIHLPFVAKRPTIAPHHHPVSPQTPSSSDTAAPATLPPCSNPYPIRTMLPSTPQFQPATQARHKRPNAHFPTPRASLPQTRSPARQYHPNHHQNPSFGLHSAPPPAQCPTGIRGNEREIDLSALSPRDYMLVRVSA